MLLLLLFLISFRIIIYCFANTNLYFILTINRHFSPIKHAFFVHFSFHFMISFCLFIMEFENIIKMTKYNKHLTKNKKGEMFSLDTNTINRVWFSENVRINGLCLNGSYEWNALNWKWTYIFFFFNLKKVLIWSVPQKTKRDVQCNDFVFFLTFILFLQKKSDSAKRLLIGLNDYDSF